MVPGWNEYQARRELPPPGKEKFVDDIHWMVREFAEGLEKGFHVIQIEGRTSTKYLPAHFPSEGVDVGDWVLVEQEVEFDVETVQVLGPMYTIGMDYKIVVDAERNMRVVSTTRSFHRYGYHNF